MLGDNAGIGFNNTPVATWEIGKYVVANALPATTGTVQSAGHIQRITSNGNNTTLDFGTDLTQSWIQSVDKSNLATNRNLLLNPNGGYVGIGSLDPAYALDAESFSMPFAREPVARFRVKDALTDGLFFGNGTIADSQFLPTIYGIKNTDNRQGLTLTGFTTATNDTALSLPAMRVQGVLTSSATDPANGTVGLVVNRPLFSVDNLDDRKLEVAANGRIKFNTYTSQTSYPGIAVASLSVDVNGDVITTSQFEVVKPTIASALPATSGTTQSTGYIQRMSSNGNDTAVDFGTDTAQGWIQSVDKSNLATNRALLLNPNRGNVGVSTTQALSSLDTDGSLGLAIRVTAIPATLGTSDSTVVLTATVTQPLPAPILRRVYHIKNGGAGTVTVTGHIDNTAANTIIIPSGSSRTFHSDGTTWWVI